MTNTINNVPCELLETLIEQHITAHGFTNHTARQAQLILCAPSPAGVDGCKGKNCGATDGASHSDECIAEHEQACGRADLNGLPVASYLIGGEPSLTPCRVRGVVNEPLCRLSGATAIIDGLRGENERIRLNIAEYNEAISCYQSERDQQAQRIGELEGLLRHAQKQVPTGSGLHMRIDAALSAVFAAAPNIATTSEHSGS